MEFPVSMDCHGSSSLPEDSVSGASGFYGFSWIFIVSGDYVSGVSGFYGFL